ncbi:recombination regulator RecX [Terribacillus halophilus]|uniref:recombination regulator RecX n=1 Tax=Terribacillus halophilus TaxID=361279 RepID=UPI0009861D28|nr:recombination regulator RecX [Terribacillus halophilus]
MVKIAKITTQKNNVGRYNIFLDDGKGEKFGFGLDEDLLIRSGIAKGKEMSEEALQSLIEKDAAHKCFTLALQYLSYRMRSKKEIKTYLLKKEQHPDHVEEALRRLEEQGYTDDAAFAGAFVRTKVNTTSKGPLVIRKELQEKGIAGKIADEAMTFYSFEKELEKAVKLANTKLQSKSKKSQQEKRQLAQQQLLSKGFTSSAAKEAVSLALSEAEPDVDAELEAVRYQGDKLVRKYVQKAEGYELVQKIKMALYRKGFSMDLIQKYLEEAKEQDLY